MADISNGVIIRMNTVEKNVTHVVYLLTFSYSVSDTVDRHDIDGIRDPPCWIVGASLATDRAPDEPCTVA